MKMQQVDREKRFYQSFLKAKKWYNDYTSINAIQSMIDGIDYAMQQTNIITQKNKKKIVSNQTIIETSKDLIEDKTLKLENLNTQVRKIKNDLLIGNYSKQSEIDKKQEIEKISSEVNILKDDIKFLKKVRKTGKIVFESVYKDRIESKNGKTIIGFNGCIAKLHKSVLRRKAKRHNLWKFVKNAKSLRFVSSPGYNQLTSRYDLLSKRYSVKLENGKNEYAKNHDTNTIYQKDIIATKEDFLKYIRLNLNNLQAYGIEYKTLKSWSSGMIPEQYTENLVYLKKYTEKHDIEFDFSIYKKIDKNLKISSKAPYTVIDIENDIPYTIDITSKDTELNINSLSYRYQLDRYAKYINDNTFITLLYQSLTYFTKHDTNLKSSVRITFNNHFHNQGWSVRIGQVNESQSLKDCKISYDELIEKRDDDTDYIGISDLSKI